MQKWFHECSSRLYVHCLSSYAFVNITHVMNLAVTSLSVTANKYGMLTEEGIFFSSLLGMLMCLLSTMAQPSTKSVNLCRIRSFLK